MKLLLTLLLLPTLAYAQPETEVLGCKVMLDRNEYANINGKTYIKEEVVAGIFNNFKAWHMIEFKVFIYVECPTCHAPHPIDYACPNCETHLQ